MVEVTGLVAWRDLGVEQSYLAQGLVLESVSLFSRGHILRCQHVPGHIETGGGQVLAQGVGRLEVDALQHPLLQVGWHRLSRLAMAGIVVEYLRYRGERLVELRGHLHEVAGHRGAAQTVVLAVGEHPVEGVAELVEERGHLVPGQQRGLSLRGLGVVAHIKYNRQLIALATLLGEAVHPGTASLRGTAEVVGIEEGERLAVLVDHLERLHIGVIGRDVLALLERQAINTVSGIEHAVEQHAVHVEVGLHLVVGDVEQFLLHLGRVIEAVIGL